MGLGMKLRYSPPDGVSEQGSIATEESLARAEEENIRKTVSILAYGCGCEIDFDVHFTAEAGFSIWVAFSSDGIPIGHYDLILDLKRKVAHLEDIEIRKVQAAENLFKRTMANIAILSQLLGLSSLTVHATKVGAYAFARMGMLPAQDDWPRLRSELKARLALAKHQLPAERYAEIASLLESDDPQTIWRVAELQDKIKL